MLTENKKLWLLFPIPIIILSVVIMIIIPESTSRRDYTYLTEDEKKYYLPKPPISIEFLPNDTLVVVRETLADSAGIGWLLFKVSNDNYPGVYQASVEPYRLIPVGTQIKVIQTLSAISATAQFELSFRIKN
jgi:hypothetical protein